MTEKRKELLKLIDTSSVPLNASQIYRELEHPMDLATVYRGLDYLEQNGFIESFVFECDKRGIERYFYLKKANHESYLHCQECHSFFSAGLCPVDKSVESLEKETGFLVLEHQLILKGLCSDCRNTQGEL